MGFWHIHMGIEGGGREVATTGRFEYTAPQSLFEYVVDEHLLDYTAPPSPDDYTATQ